MYTRLMKTFQRTTQTPEEIQEHKKHTCARQIYRDRSYDTLTPKSVKSTSTKKKVTWAQWFENMYGENYFDYVKRKQQEKQRGKS